MSGTQGSRVEEIRKSLGVPVIDSDGHIAEFVPAVRDHMREVGGGDLVQAFDATLGAGTLFKDLPADQRRDMGLFQLTWWAYPAKNSLDRATAMLPSLLYERLDELGLDYAVIYPTHGLTPMSLDQPELRQAMARAFNCYLAESFRDYSDRLTAVAVIPMHTPEEAIAELEYAVGSLGTKAVVMAGQVLRPLSDDGPRAARWVDCLGFDSPFDYDPVWEKCRELKISPTFHSTGMGWGTHTSQHNYVFNHLHAFSTSSEACARSLFMSGVPKRFPELRFAFLEGGASWACSLYASLLGHWEKRNRDHVQEYNPEYLDVGLLRDLFKRYGSQRYARHLDEVEESLRNVLPNDKTGPDRYDDFAASGVNSPEEIRDLFVGSFHFGCEADDPMNAAAFNGQMNPMGARLKAVFSSDIGHWDVPDMREVVEEAYELLEDGLIGERDLRDFVWGNAISLWAGTNPDFFEGTSVEAAVRAELAGG